MKQRHKTLIAIIIVGIHSTAFAGPIFQDIAGIENLEWLELTSTESMSRDEVASQLGSNGAFEGWRYASRREVETLYDGLWGGLIDNTSPSNYPGARRFFDAFGQSGANARHNNSGYDSNGRSYWNAHFGNPGECSGNLSETCRAFVSINDTSYGAAFNTGYFGDAAGLSTGVDAINEQEAWPLSVSAPGVGSHLVRNQSIKVPEPSAISTICFGLLLLAARSVLLNKHIPFGARGFSG